MNWLVTLLVALLPSLAVAQVVSVDFKDKGFCPSSNGLRQMG
jgi:hypothetical protein